MLKTKDFFSSCYGMFRIMACFVLCLVGSILWFLGFILCLMDFILCLVHNGKYHNAIWNVVCSMVQFRPQYHSIGFSLWQWWKGNRWVVPVVPMGGGAVDDKVG